jgi:flagellar assembly factor FliW
LDISSLDDVQIDILKGVTVKGFITIDSTKMTDNANLEIQAIPYSKMSMRYAISKEMEIEANSNGVGYSLTLPLNDNEDKYIIGYNLDGSNFVPKGYYNSTKTEPYMNNATPISTTGKMVIEDIDLTLISGFLVSGTLSFNQTINNKAVLIRAIREDGYEVFNVININEPTTAIGYGIGVPLSLNNSKYKIGYYVLEHSEIPTLANGIASGFYSQNKTVSSFNEADFITVDADKSGINFNAISNTFKTIEIKAGWNLLSLPVDTYFTPVDMTINFGFNNKIDLLAKYDSFGWSYYFVNSYTASVNRFNSLDSSDGFWLKANSSFVLKYALKDNLDNKTKELYEGWNLVGFGKDMTTQEIVNIYKDYDIISIWGYKNGKWSVFVPDELVATEVYKTNTKLENVSQFDGVWINVNGEQK